MGEIAVSSLSLRISRFSFGSFLFKVSSLRCNKRGRSSRFCGFSTLRIAKMIAMPVVFKLGDPRNHLLAMRCRVKDYFDSLPTTGWSTSDLGAKDSGDWHGFETELLRNLPYSRRPEITDAAEARRARVVQCSGVPDREGKARSERTNDSEQTSRTSSITTERSLPLGHRVRLRGLASSVRSSLAG